MNKIGIPCSAYVNEIHCKCYGERNDYIKRRTF